MKVKWVTCNGGHWCPFVEPEADLSEVEDFGIYVISLLSHKF